MSSRSNKWFAGATLPFPGPAGRRYGLDWLRAGATLMVVALHAGIPYMEHPLPGLVWSISAVETSGAVDLCCWTINGFVMPLFFLMSGYFARNLHDRKGPGAFLDHRLRRIGGALLLGFVLILPLDLYVWLLGWVGEGWIPLQKLNSLKVEGPLGEALWGLSHLWFLAYLLVFYVLFLIMHRVVIFAADLLSQTAVGHEPHERSGRRLSWVLPAAILFCGVVLWREPRIVIGFRHGWFPFIENLLYYTVPFGLGWYWSDWTDDGAGIRRWTAVLATAVVAFVLLWGPLVEHLEQETIPVANRLVPLLFAAFGLTAATAMFGLTSRAGFRPPPQAIQYIAQASFWIYLLHHPVVGLVHIDLRDASLTTEVKFLIAMGTGVAVSLLTYDALVRRTWVGVLLNGRRERPRSVRRIAPSDLRQPTRRAA